MRVRGFVTIKYTDPSGKLRLNYTGSNIVTLAGKVRVAEVFSTNDLSKKLPAYMRIGDGAVPPTVDDTGLSGVVHASALAALLQISNEITWTATFSNNPINWIVNEVGMFTDAPENLLFARFLSPKFTLEVGGAAMIDWKIAFGSEV